jgi:hypothetical protein
MTQIVIGVESEAGEPFMEYHLFDEGVKFADDRWTRNDLLISVAILRDLADALEAKLNMMSN